MSSIHKPFSAISAEQKRSMARLAAVQELYGWLIKKQHYNKDDTFDLHFAWIDDEPDFLIACNLNFFRKLTTHALQNRYRYKTVMKNHILHRQPGLLFCAILFAAIAEQELRANLSRSITVSEYLQLCRDFFHEDDIPFFHALLDTCLKNL